MTLEELKKAVESEKGKQLDQSKQKIRNLENTITRLQKENEQIKHDKRQLMNRCKVFSRGGALCIWCGFFEECAGEWAENPSIWKMDGTGECLAWLQTPLKEEK